MREFPADLYGSQVDLNAVTEVGLACTEAESLCTEAGSIWTELLMAAYNDRKMGGSQNMCWRGSEKHYAIERLRLISDSRREILQYYAKEYVSTAGSKAWVG